MAFDFKKEYREFYLPKNRPEIVTVPRANFVAVRGSGDPNCAGGEYQRAMSVLYSVAYTLRMSGRSGHRIEGFFEYVVPPLEGLWWQAGRAGVDYQNKAAFSWISMIRLPDFVTEGELRWAVESASEKKQMDCGSAEFLSLEEGLCVQMMHIGPFDEEPASIARMVAFLAENGCACDFSQQRRHHEIYLSDARRTAPERLKTVLRLPIRRL